MILRFELDTDNINDIMLEGMRNTLKRAPYVRWVDVQFRVNGEFVNYEADWLKHLREMESDNE